jgi:hypothetical protein
VRQGGNGSRPWTRGPKGSELAIQWELLAVILFPNSPVGEYNAVIQHSRRSSHRWALGIRTTATHPTAGTQSLFVVSLLFGAFLLSGHFPAVVDKLLFLLTRDPRDSRSGSVCQSDPDLESLSSGFRGSVTGGPSPGSAQKTGRIRAARTLEGPCPGLALSRETHFTPKDASVTATIADARNHVPIRIRTSTAIAWNHVFRSREKLMMER